MSEYRDRIEALADRASADRHAFDPPDDPPDEAAALEYLREGVGDAVAVYVDARTGEFVPLEPAEMELLERAVNDWLAVYARCHGREIDPDVTVRELAEAVVDTHDLVASARVLTGVPSRRGGY